MGNYRKPKKSSGGKKLLKFIIILIIIGAVGPGLNYYRKYVQEKKRLAALEEQKRKEELEKERQRKILEERQKELITLIEEMKKYFASGNLDRVRELGSRALALAQKYNFNTDEIYRILHDADAVTYRGKLKELQEMNRDVYKYLYVRDELIKIPEWQELKKTKTGIMNKTYENEYRVKLALAKSDAITGKKGEMSSFYYLASRQNFDNAIRLRQEHEIARSAEEDAVRELQRELFFSLKELTEKTIPPSLY